MSGKISGTRRLLRHAWHANAQHPGTGTDDSEQPSVAGTRLALSGSGSALRRGYPPVYLILTAVRMAEELVISIEGIAELITTNEQSIFRF